MNERSTSETKGAFPTPRSKLTPASGYSQIWTKWFRSGIAIARPKPSMNVPQWADSYRKLSASVGAVSGAWQTARVEVARGTMMAVTEPGVRTITAMTCTQTLKTELLTNTFGYHAHLDPSPMLLLEPKDEMASAFSKERLAPMIASSPELKKIMGDRKSRNSDDTIQYKTFPGGFLAISSAGSPSNLAMRAIRIVLEDEIDKYEVTKEGDPITLAEERMATFNTSSLAIRACSPTWEETSRIYQSYQTSDQRKPFCQCPHCKEWQTLDFFKHVQWVTDEDGTHHPETAAIYCEFCGTEWTEAQRLRIVSPVEDDVPDTIRFYQTREFSCNCTGDTKRHNPVDERCWQWVRTEDTAVGYACCPDCGRRGVSNHHAGFQVSKLYSPFITVIELATKWLDSKDDVDTKQTFYNTQLGLPFQVEASKAVDKHWLASRREQYPTRDGKPVLPGGVLVLTAGLDVQSGSDKTEGRVEVEVVGWGLNEESWSIETEVFYGDPAKPDVWKNVDAFLMKPWMHQRGFDLYIAAACIDSGGGATQEVYNFARARVGRNVWAIKGASDRSNDWSPIWPASMKESKHQKHRTGWKVTILGVNAGKEAVRQRLLISEPGPGYCHFPLGRPEGWFEQLTSEQLRIERKMGVKLRKWVLPRGLANEGLDCRVYAYSALQGLYHTRLFNMERQFELLASIIVEDGKVKKQEPLQRQVRGGLD